MERLVSNRGAVNIIKNYDTSLPSNSKKSKSESSNISLLTKNIQIIYSTETFIITKYFYNKNIQNMHHI
ncbi:hypothetical protein MERGE_001400 [Pneumocystis wakefieldiae]|uniref:Uncharacterized protein n=1 Tax=Pneumocystis wakefieldiae TaxID=38082 RepID=A0A899G2M5_9ASCO|nr:hypothetical protein MERGE_001400 [Pneumocystis wakefieldiae]